MPRPYYVLGELTSGLEPVARHAARLAGLIEKHLPPRRKVSKCEDSLVQDVSRWLVTGNDKALDALIVNVRRYARCFRDVGRERRFNMSTIARIHVMAACDLLAESLPREKVTKALVRKAACDLGPADPILEPCRPHVTSKLSAGAEFIPISDCLICKKHHEAKGRQNL